MHAGMQGHGRSALTDHLLMLVMFCTCAISSSCRLLILKRFSLSICAFSSSPLTDDLARVPAIPVSSATSLPSPVTLDKSEPIDTMTAGLFAVGASRIANSSGVNHLGPK